MSTDVKASVDDKELERRRKISESMRRYQIRRREEKMAKAAAAAEGNPVGKIILPESQRIQPAADELAQGKQISQMAPATKPQLQLVANSDLKSTIRAVLEEILDEELNPKQQNQNAAAQPLAERELELSDDMYVVRKVRFIPRIFEYYRYTKAISGNSIDFDEWVNSAIEEHFNECLSIESAILRRPQERKGLGLK
jgi:hypothetical protein